MAKKKPTTVYDGKFLSVKKRGKWEYVTRKKISGIVGIVAVTNGGKLVLIEQFRPPVGKSVIEIPAGLAGDVKGQETEDLANAARRELHEETGYEAEEMIELAVGTASAGLSDELITIFLAKGLKKNGDGAGDGSEQITVHEVPLGKVESWLEKKVEEGLLVDLKVYSGLYFANRGR